MARLPEWIDENDRQNILQLKRDKLSLDDIVLAFGGKYKRGKIAGEVARAEKSGELFPGNDTPIVVPQIAAPSPMVSAAGPYPMPQSRVIPTSTWVVNNPQPNVTYNQISPPTVILTSPPQPPPTPFNMFEYAVKKAIDAAVQRPYTLQAPQNLAPPLPDTTQFARFNQMVLGHEQRDREDRERRERERRESQEKDRAERQRRDEEQQAHLNQFQQDLNEIGDKLNRENKANVIEFGNLLRQTSTNESRWMQESVRTSEAMFLESEKARANRQAKYDEAEQNDLEFYRDSNKQVERMMARLDQYQKQQIQQHPGIRLYQAVQNEVHEEIQTRQELRQRQRNKEVVVGLFGAALILAGEVLKSYNATCNSRYKR